MSEYIVRKNISDLGLKWDVEQDARIIQQFSYFGEDLANALAILLNSETAALRQQIADLQAENAKLKADCASYDTVLNQVAIGYLEATEKLQQVEVKESPALAETEAIVTPVVEEKPKTVGEITSELIKGGYELGVKTLAHLRFEKQFAETRVRVNWSGNGFSSGSYKLISSFAKFGRNWHTIEVITDKVMQYTVNAEKSEIVS